jgi:hypothetical protein
MFEWLASAASSTVFKLFGDTIVQPILSAYLKSKDVELEKFKGANVSTEHLAIVVLDANVRFAQVKSQYALAVLQWWPFRVILWVILAIAATRFCLIMMDQGRPVAGHPLVPSLRQGGRLLSGDTGCRLEVEPYNQGRCAGGALGRPLACARARNLAAVQHARTHHAYPCTTPLLTPIICAMTRSVRPWCLKRRTSLIRRIDNLWVGIGSPHWLNEEAVTRLSCRPKHPAPAKRCSRSAEIVAHDLAKYLLTMR